MSEPGKLGKGIHSKIKDLISLHNSLKHQNDDLKTDKKQLKQKIEDQNKLIEQLKDRNKNLKIAKSVKQSEGNNDVKKGIDELVREIDKCVGLLNI